MLVPYGTHPRLRRISVRKPRGGRYKAKKLLTLFTILAVVLVAVTACQPGTGNTSNPASGVTPQPITSPPPPRTNWEKGSPPPAGIGGWQQPRRLTDDEKARVVQIAVSSPAVSAWLQGRTDYSVGPVNWYAIIWSDGEAGQWWSLEYKIVDEGIPGYVSPYAYWYPGVTISVGQDIIYLMQIAVDLDAGRTAMTSGPLPSPGSPGRFRTPTPTPSTASSNTISKEQAIETASKTLRPSIVSRAEIKAEVHGWYWEVIFDNLNAEADELMPFPLKGPLPPLPGQPTPEPYPGIWQSVVITVDAQTGDLKSGGARRAPRPGPYVSQSQAIESARGFVLRDWPWIDGAKVEAYLVGDKWTVLFWQEGSTDHRVKASVDAVTGAATGASRG